MIHEWSLLPLMQTIICVILILGTIGIYNIKLQHFNIHNILKNLRYFRIK